MQKTATTTQSLNSLKAGVVSAMMMIAASFAAAIAFSGSPLEAQPIATAPEPAEAVR